MTKRLVALWRGFVPVWLPTVLVLLAASPLSADEKDYDFNFDSVDIQTFVKVVGQITGKRFVVDGELDGRVTVVSSKVNRDDIYPLFLSVLEHAGYSVVEDDGMNRIVPLAGSHMVIARVVGPEEETPEKGMITKIIRLEHVSATLVRNMLATMRGGERQVSGIGAIEETNHLVVTDTADSIRRIERIVAEIDRPGSARVMEVIPLTYAQADDLADEINGALAESQSRATKLKQRLGAEAPERSVSAVIASPQANALVAVGTSAQVAAIRELVSKMDVDVSSGRGRLNAIFLRYVDAEKAAESIAALLEKRAGGDASKLKIGLQASAANNALLVDASPGDFESVRKLVDQLDGMPNQMLIDVRILEYSSSDGEDIGFTFAAGDAPEKVGDTVAQGSVALGDSSGDLLNALQQGIFPGGISVGVASGVRLDGDGNLVLGYPGVLNIDALLSTGKFHIMSETSLQAQDNREANISIVNNIPVLTSTIEGGSGTSRDVIQNIDRMDVGIKLTLTPHVIPETSDISMDLAPSIEAVIESQSDSALTPTIARREVSTSVRVGNGQTAVIAGLTRRDKDESVARVPYISRIPLLGKLFTRTVNSETRTDLLILVTPHITTDIAAADAERHRLQQRTGLNGPDDGLDVLAPPSP